jgi:hypothetical protein
MNQMMSSILGWGKNLEAEEFIRNEENLCTEKLMVMAHFSRAVARRTSQWFGQ